MYSRVSGNGNLFRQACARPASVSATATALTWSPTGSATLIAEPANSMRPLSTMASNTG